MCKTISAGVRNNLRAYSASFASMALVSLVSTVLFAQTPKARSVVAYSEAKLAFEQSKNSNGLGESFTTKGHGYAVELSRESARIELPGAEDKSGSNAVSLRWLNAEPAISVTSEGRMSGVSNYLPSSDPRTWRMGVPAWERVNYRGIYPGVDLSFYGKQQKLEYDFRLKPLADPNLIRLALGGIEKASVDADGNLVLGVGSSSIRFLKPEAYQASSRAERIPIEARYVLSAPTAASPEWTMSFALGGYDASKELIIDPVLSYGLEPAYADYTVSGVAADATGNLYVAGQNQAKGFYVSKYTSTGTLVFNTVIGAGTATTYPTGITVDSTGNIYVAGSALPGLPTTSNAYQTVSPSSKTYFTAPFVAVMPTTGTAPTYLSYLGGTTGYDYASGIAVSAGQLYLTGYESSTNFPTTTGAYLSTYPGSTYAAFVARIDHTKSGAASLVYSTLLGASTISSVGSAISADAAGNAYVAVQSNQGYPVTTGAYAYRGGYSDAYTLGAYITKVNPAGTGLVYSAYLGPGAITGIATDTSLDSYVTGAVYADDFPTSAGAYQTTYPGGFAAELNPGGTALVYSTFLSGPSGAYSPASNSVFPQSIAITPGCASACAAYVGGYTSASDFPAVNAIQSEPTLNVTPNAFITELAGNGASALFSTYLGGITGYVTSPFSTLLFPTPAVQVDSSGNMYMAANITAADFPVTLPTTTPLPYSYIAKISPAASGLIVPYPVKLDFDNYNSGGQAVGVSSTVTGVPVPLLLRNLGSAPITISSLTFTPAAEFSETDSCAMTVPAGGTCTLNLAFNPTAAGLRSATLSIASNGTVSPVNVPLSGTGVAQGYLQVSTADVTFPDVALGASSAQQMITINNIGKTAVSLPAFTIYSVRATWGTGSDFQVLSNCPAQIAAAASCTIGVTFHPLATGPRAAYFYLQGSGFGDGYIYLYGTGISGTAQGTVALSATLLNFNAQLVNSTVTRQTLVLNNTSSFPVFVYGLSIATAGQTGKSDFSITNSNCYSSGPVQVVPQGTCSITIGYSPTVAAAETGTLTITDSATGSPRSVALTGTGVAAAQSLEFTPGNSVFPDQPVGVPSTAQYFYVYNTGTAPITVDRVLAAGDFSIASTTCAGAILKPNPSSGYDPSPSCNVRVVFTPSAAGARTGSVSFVDTSAATPQVLTLAGNGIVATGGLFLEPSTLVYGAQAVGTTSATQRLNVTNPGNSPISISNIAATGNYGLADTCAAGTFPYVLGAQRSCAVDVTFTPTTVSSPITGSVVVTSSAGSATMSATGTGVAATTALGLTPTAAAFGNIAVAVQSFGYNIYVRNTGSESLTLTSGAITGTNLGDYLFSGGSCGFYGNLLAPGASCYVQVYFTPAAAGSRVATLSLVDSAGTQTEALTGTGVATLTGAIPAPAGVSFDQVPVGSTSGNNQTVYLHNYGTAALLIASAKISAGGSSFLIPVGTDGCTGTTIAASSLCGVQLSFAPTTAGYMTGTLTFTDSKSVQYSVPLAGYSPTVVVAAFVDPTTLSFPGQVLTTYSTAQSITLNNASDTPLTVATLTGTNVIVGATTTGAFSTSGVQGGYDGCSGMVVAARGKCAVSVTLAPTAAGAATGSIVFPVTYSNGAKASFTTTLSGTGLAIKDIAELSPSSLNFPDQTVGAIYSAGADQTQTINLWNTGNLPFTVGALAGTDAVVGSTTTGDFTTSSTYGGYDGCTSQTVSVGSYCGVTIAFNPGAAGAKAGSIKFPVTYSDKTTTTLTATLAGKGIAVNSKVVVSPASGQFDNQVIGTTSDSSEVLTFTVTNAGNLPVKVSTATVTSNFSFVSDSCSGTSITVASYCQIVIAFSPTTTGVITGTLSIPDTAAGTPQKVALTGTGVAANQQLVLSQTSVNFGNQVVSTKSAVVSVLVSNQSAATVPVSSVVLGGANASDFIETNSCAGSSIYGHSNCQISVQFAPAAASVGVRTATVTETDSATGSPRVITLTGTGTASSPLVALYPSSLNFGNQGLSTKSAPLTFSVTNTGSTSLVISTVTSSNATEFPLSGDGCSHQTIAAGADCLVSVSFDPNAGSTQTATISVADNATGSPQTLVATGVSVGIPQAVLTPTTLTFAAEGVGITSAAASITLSDPGTDTLDIASIVISGTNATDFKQTNTCGTSIVAKANCVISVTFDPAAVGSRTATLTVTDNAGNVVGTLQTATLNGTGTGVPKIAFSPTSLSFASTDVGASSAAVAITVSNPGTATLPITSVGIVPTGDFTETNTCGTQLLAGATCSISVTFSPKTAGARTAAVSVADGATGSPQTVALSGTAIGIPTASLSATSIAFGSQAVGVVSGAQPVTLTNTGSGSLVVASLAFSGANASDFAETATGCPGTLAPAAACTIKVTFKPGAAGARSATLTITDNSGNVAGSTQPIALTGTGSGTPQAALSVSTLTFASDAVGTPEGPQTSTLSNAGNGPLQITSIAVTGADAKDFLQFNTCTPSVAAGGNCEVAVYFIPSAAGTRTASVVITDNANNVVGATQTITLTGTATGIPLATLSATTLNFGTVKTGTQSAGQSIILTNTGNVTLTVSGVTLAGTDPGDYSLFNSCSSLTAGSNCEAVVFFKPTAVGSRPATLIFTDNANNVAGSKQSVTLTGTGN